MIWNLTKKENYYKFIDNTIFTPWCYFSLTIKSLIGCPFVVVCCVILWMCKESIRKQLSAEAKDAQFTSTSRTHKQGECARPQAKMRSIIWSTGEICLYFSEAEGHCLTIIDLWGELFLPFINYFDCSPGIRHKSLPIHSIVLKQMIIVF